MGELGVGGEGRESGDGGCRAQKGAFGGEEAAGLLRREGVGREEVGEVLDRGGIEKVESKRKRGWGRMVLEEDNPGGGRRRRRRRRRRR